MKRLFYLFVFAFLMGCATTLPPASDWVAPDDEVTASVQPDTPARFNGGSINDFRLWVARQVHYPDVLSTRGIGGKVMVAFVVEEDGSIGSIEIMMSPHKLLGQEVVRVIKRSPRWTPAMQGDRPVRQRFTFWAEFVTPKPVELRGVPVVRNRNLLQPKR